MIRDSMVCKAYINLKVRGADLNLVLEIIQKNK